MGRPRTRGARVRVRRQLLRHLVAPTRMGDTGLEPPYLHASCMGWMVFQVNPAANRSGAKPGWARLQQPILLAVLSIRFRSELVVSLCAPGALPGEGFGQARSDVGGLVFLLEDDIPIFKLSFGHAIAPPGHLQQRRVGDDERIEDYRRITQTRHVGRGCVRSLERWAQPAIRVECGRSSPTGTAQ